jgi:hypothetical protein
MPHFVGGRKVENIYFAKAMRKLYHPKNLLGAADGLL